MRDPRQRPRRRGRPAKQPDEKRTEKLGTRLTAQQADAFYRIAIRRDRKPESLLRALVVRFLRKNILADFPNQKSAN